MSSDQHDAPDEEDRGSDKSEDSREGLTFEEWNRMATEANPLDSSLKKKREFKRVEPPIEAIKLYRRERTYYLLNRREQAITQLRYQTVSRDVNTNQGKAVQLFEVTDVPGCSYFKVGEMDLQGETRLRFTLGRVEWEDGETFEDEKSPTLYQPSIGGVPPLDRTDLILVEVEPTVIKTREL
jgi:hypothetical protein